MQSTEIKLWFARLIETHIGSIYYKQKQIAGSASYSYINKQKLFGEMRWLLNI